jgi:hypothetical protein
MISGRRYKNQGVPPERLPDLKTATHEGDLAVGIDLVYRHRDRARLGEALQAKSCLKSVGMIQDLIIVGNCNVGLCSFPKDPRFRERAIRAGRLLDLRVAFLR